MITLTEIIDADRLEEYFKFRYQIYKNSMQEGFLEEGADTDKDEYDENAIHLGWYENGELKGCLRFIRPIEKADSLFAFTHMPIDIRIKAETFMRLHTMTDKPFVEVSRICIAPDKRNRATVTDFVLATVAEAMDRGLDQALFTCHESHLMYWHMHGFQILEGTGEWKCNRNKQYLSYCMTYEKSKIPTKILDRLAIRSEKLNGIQSAA